MAETNNESGVVQKSTKKTGCETNPITFACIFFFFLSLILLILVLIEACEKYHAPKPPCSAKECTILASSILSAADFDTIGCENFYQFSCGNFIRQNIVPEGKFMIDIYTDYERKKQLQLRNLIESRDVSSKEPNVVYRTQEAYRICLNISNNKDEEINDLKDIVMNTLQEFHSDNPIRNSNYLFEDYIGKMIRRGQENFLFGLSIQPNYYTNDKYIIHISEPSVGIFRTFTKTSPKGYQENTNDVERLNKPFILKASAFLEYKISQKEVDEIIELEMALSQLIWRTSESWNQEKTTIQTLNNLTGNVLNWLEIFNSAFKDIHTFDFADSVMVNHKENIINTFQIIDKFPQRILQNYIAFRHMKTAGNILKRVFDKALNNNLEEETFTSYNTRWIDCLDWLHESYPLVLSRLFVDKYIKKESIKIAEEIIQFIQGAYKQMIRASKWLEENAKNKAILKIDKMKKLIAYPDIILNNDELEKEYNHIPLLFSSHIKNVAEIKANTTLRNMHFINHAVDQYRWFVDPLDETIVYNLQTNSFTLPVGIMQSPYLDVNDPAFINFGILGVRIAREISHGIDDKGSRFDESGRIYPWWEKETYEAYNQRTKCFVDQYNKYCLENTHTGKTLCVNGEKSLRENIADNSGLKAAYEGYKLWIEKYGEESPLPGSPLNMAPPEDVFFIIYGYSWCQNVHQDKWETLFVQDDSFVPAHYRINGTLENFEEFSKSFYCNDQNKIRCKLWG